MTTTRVLVTALPVTLADDAPVHLTAFVTHKLDAGPEDSTLAAFPAAADWPGTLAAGRFELLASNLADPVPLVVVSAPDGDAWAAVFPPGTRVDGFPAPDVATAQWNSYPAHRLSDHAVDLHVTSLTAAPTLRPPVLTNPALAGFVSVISQFSRSLAQMPELAQERAQRQARLVARRTLEAQVNLGLTAGRGREGYPTRVDDVTSPIEVLLDDEGTDERLTKFLDSQVGQPQGTPEAQVLVDAHATRRFYDRPEEQTPYQPHPTPDKVPPRPDKPDPDFHARAASLGSTPALLRVLGLAVDLVVPEAADRAALVGSTWVAVRFVPGEGSDVTRQAPPRTQVVVRGGRFDAVSSDAWVGGAVPLGDDAYVVLDLDPDASGLKLDQHLRSLPRLVASETNGDTTTGAPGTLRTSGFGIARTDRVDATRARVTAAQGLDAPDDGPGVTGPSLTYDDVVRGLRLEVWDDRSRAWHSLHERRVDVRAEGDAGPRDVLVDAPDVGFLQASALNRVPGDPSNPYYLHEVIAGWDGWSLSAPRPGRVIVSEDEPPRETPEDAEVSGVHVTTRVQPGSLPRLRWGTSYAFRLVGVDLAGNSVPRATGRPPLPPPLLEQAREQAEAHLSRLRTRYQERDANGLVRAVRDRVIAALPGDDRLGDGLLRRVEGGAPPPPPEPRTPQERIDAFVPPFARTGAAEIDEALADRVRSALRRTAWSAGTTAVGPAAGVSETPQVVAGAGPGASLVGDEAGAAFRRVAAASRVLAQDAPAWRVRPQLAVDRDLFADLAAVPDLEVPDEVRLGRRPVVTTPRPYLRWAPVPPPALVAQSALTTGEQLSRVVVRSGLAEGHPDDAAVSARHVLPAKTTQLDAETDGKFDLAIGSTDADAQRVAYAVALAERGTLLDRNRPDLDDATATVPQDGIALLARPGADPATAVTLEDIEARRDTPLGEGQYVVHGTDALTLPYLPDTHAAGVALVFFDAGAPHLLPEPRVLQTVVLPFPGDWPRVEPLRLVVERGDVLGAHLDGRDVRVQIPKGEQVRVAMSSSLRSSDLDDFGLWRSHLASTIDPDGDGTATEEQVIAAAVLLRAATSGWTWWLTPSTELRLVHAVPAPVRPPQVLGLRCLIRPPGLTVAQLAGMVDLHGPSTERLLLRATWQEWVDDVAAPGPERVERHDVVVDSPVWSGETTGLLWLIDHHPSGTDVLGTAGLGIHRALQTFKDTHHRDVTYTPSGATRYREMFAPADVPPDDDPALAGAPVTLDIPSSARPAGPEIVDTVPILRWEQGTEPDQPFALRRTRRSGVRIWLRRPWFSSGDGELLGVVLAAGPVPPAPEPSGPEPTGDTSSVWGRDPIYQGAHVTAGSSLPLVEVAQLLAAGLSGGTYVPREARPVLPAATLPLLDVEGSPNALVLGYRPEFHPDRGQWYVDVAVDEGPVLWPFLRLAVARYQPSAIPGCALSPLGLTSWVQPLPSRTATVNRPDADHVRVTVTGTVSFLRVRGRGEGLPGREGSEIDADAPTGSAATFDAVLRQTRTVHARVQVLDEGATDLEWRTVATRRLPAVGVGDETTFRVTWTGDLPLPAGQVPLRTPGSSTTYRVLVEENELMDADAPDVPNIEGRTVPAPRVVYTDAIPL